jgi:hypothetical protein
MPHSYNINNLFFNRLRQNVAPHSTDSHRPLRLSFAPQLPKANFAIPNGRGYIPGAFSPSKSFICQRTPEEQAHLGKMLEEAITDSLREDAHRAIKFKMKMNPSSEHITSSPTSKTKMCYSRQCVFPSLFPHSVP